MSAPELKSINPIKFFTKHYNDWLRQRSEMTFRYADIGLALEDREFNLFLSLTSISGAFLAVVLPIVSNSGLIFQFASYVFLVDLFLGFGFMLISMSYSKKRVREDSNFVHDYYDKLIETSSILMDKSEAGIITQKDVNDYYSLRDKFGVISDEKMASHKKELQSRLLNRGWIFYAAFMLGVITLFLNLLFGGTKI